jgi:hypothetical protein
MSICNMLWIFWKAYDVVNNIDWGWVYMIYLIWLVHPNIYNIGKRLKIQTFKIYFPLTFIFWVRITNWPILTCLCPTFDQEILCPRFLLFPPFNVACCFYSWIISHLLFFLFVLKGNLQLLLYLIFTFQPPMHVLNSPPHIVSLWTHFLLLLPSFVFMLCKTHVA